MLNLFSCGRYSTCHVLVAANCCKHACHHAQCTADNVAGKHPVSTAYSAQVATARDAARCSMQREAAKQCRSDRMDFSCCAKKQKNRVAHSASIMFPRRPCTCCHTGRVSCHLPRYVGLARVCVCAQCAEECTCFKPTCRLEPMLKGVWGMGPFGFFSTGLWIRCQLYGSSLCCVPSSFTSLRA